MAQGGRRRGAVGRADAGVLVVARLLRRGTLGTAARGADSGSARLLRSAHVSPHRPRRHLPHALVGRPERDGGLTLADPRCRMLGIEIPIIQAPMGYIARAQLASAVSNAGGMGIIETSSGRLDEVKLEIAQDARPHRQAVGRQHRAAVRPRPAIVDFVVDHGVRFVTTSAGDPPCSRRAERRWYHGLSRRADAAGRSKAIAAGVDGLVVEGIEGGGFKNADGRRRWCWCR